MIAVDFKTTAGTPVQAILQPDLLPVPAIRAVLMASQKVTLPLLPKTGREPGAKSVGRRPREENAWSGFPPCFPTSGQLGVRRNIYFRLREKYLAFVDEGVYNDR